MSKGDVALNASTTAQTLFLGGSEFLNFHDQPSQGRAYAEPVAKTISCTESRSLLSELFPGQDIEPGWLNNASMLNYIWTATLYNGFQPPEPLQLHQFMEEHLIDADVVQACVCADAHYSDLPRYDRIEYDTLAGGTFGLGLTVTGGTSGATATMIEVDTTDPGTLTLIDTVGVFVAGEGDRE